MSKPCEEFVQDGECGCSESHFEYFPTVIFDASELPPRGRDDRIEHYYQESAWDLAEWLVDAEDEIEMWKARVARLEEEASAQHPT